MNSEVISATLPKATLPAEPACIMRPRHRSMACRDKVAISSNGKRGAEPEGEHHGRDLAEILPLRGEQGGRAERGTDTGRPDRAEHEADRQLSEASPRRDSGEQSTAAIADAASRDCKPALLRGTE